MHARISDAERRALAVLINGRRPDWDVPGIAAVIASVRDRDPLETYIAFLRGTTRTDQRTPAFLARDGAHWHSPSQTATDVRFERCTEPGHTSFPAWNCSACKADRLEGTHPRSAPEPDRDRAAMYARGADTARQALAAAQTTKEDA